MCVCVEVLVCVGAVLPFYVVDVFQSLALIPVHFSLSFLKYTYIYIYVRVCVRV